MTKVYKLTVLVVDLDDLGLDGIADELDTAIVMHQESREVEWDDDHPLNKKDTYQAEFDRLFGDTK